MFQIACLCTKYLIVHSQPGIRGQLVFKSLQAIRVKAMPDKKNNNTGVGYSLQVIKKKDASFDRQDMADSQERMHPRGC